MSTTTFRSRRFTLPGPADEDLNLVYLDNETTASPCTLFLVHGFFDHKATWSRLGAALGDQYRLVLPDLLGCGYSDKPSLAHLEPEQRYAPAMHAQYLSYLIEHLDLRNLVLGGNSLGGGIALYLWLHYPKIRARTRGLLLIDAAAYPQPLPGYIAEMAGVLGALLNLPPTRRLLFRLGLARWSVRRTFRRVFYAPDKIPADQVAGAVDMVRQADRFYVYRWMARNVMMPDIDNFVARFKEIDCPTQIIWGEEDCIISPLAALQFKESIPHADLRIIERCGHTPHLECPDQVVACIREWMPPI